MAKNASIMKSAKQKNEFKGRKLLLHGLQQENVNFNKSEHKVDIIQCQKMLHKWFLVQILLVYNIYAKDLQNLLTKKSSRLWLMNETNEVNQSNPYCSVCCVDVKQPYKGRKCGIHTMCVYASKPIGPACKGLIIMNFSESEIDTVVDAHNTVRNRVAMGLEIDGDPGPQPPAANMRLMSWDSELANVATVWATQCVFAHDACRDLSRFPVGQSIANGTYASKTDLEHIADWYDLVQYVNEDMLRSLEPEKYGDLAYYTQLVWADTYLVGCARVSFQQLVNGQITYREHFICNYGPSGNIAHQPVYKIGEACSACSEGTFCTDPDYPGLCGNEVLDDKDLKQRKKKHSKKIEANNNNNCSIIFTPRYLHLVFIFTVLFSLSAALEDFYKP